jgi:hypothetical protein
MQTETESVEAYVGTARKQTAGDRITNIVSNLIVTVTRWYHTSRPMHSDHLYSCASPSEFWFMTYPQELSSSY